MRLGRVSVGVLLTSLLAVLGSTTQTSESKSSDANKNVASEIVCPDMGRVKSPGKTNCDECVRDKPKDPSGRTMATENPNSPKFYQVDKNMSYYKPPVSAGDNGHILKVDLTAPGKIISVIWDCHGKPCGWVHPCDGAQCVGHNIPVEYHGDNTATWWGWSNSGDNAAFVFTVHYE